MTYTPLDELIKIFDYEILHSKGGDTSLILTHTETITLLHYLKWIRAERIRKHKTEE